MASSRRKPNLSRKEEIELGSRMRGKLKKSGNVKSRDSDRSTDDGKPFKAVDVVVDVHRELERKEQSSRETEETIIQVLTADATNGGEKKSRNERRNSNGSQPQNFAAQKKSIDESLDLIEEFKENESRNERSAVLSQDSELLVGSSVQVPRRRKQWKTTQDVEEVREKPARRRWSKNGSVFRLPETRRSASSTISSPHDSNTSIPVPAPRSGLKHNSFFSFDNPAFVSDNESEDILRIETNYNDEESTRIEMRSMKHMTEVDLSQDEMEQKQQSNKTFQDHIETIEISNESDTDEESSSEKSHIVSDRGKSPIAKSSESETYLFSGHSSKESTLFTNGDSNEDLHRRSRSERESTSTPLSKKSSKLVKQRSRLEKKPKVKARRREEAEEAEEAEEVRSGNKAKRKKKKSVDEKNAKKDLKYISIRIHRADMLETDYITKHPMVRVHIVEAESGSYLKSTVNEANNYLQPIITGKFDFKENKSMVPVWEEELVFEHDFDVIERTDDKRVLILFEVLDLLSFAEASCNYDRFGNEGCWYKIAWAFLKPVGVNNILHFNKMVRLQLYRPRRTLKKVGRHKCEVYQWWKSKIREKYCSSLFVTVTSVKPPKLEPILYQQLSFNEHSDCVLNRNELQRTSACRTSDTISLPKWSRLAAQSCKIPNEKLFDTEVSENGCFFVAFSNNGQFLACVNSEEYDYPIVVYEMETRKINVQFKGHKTFVYSVNWCNDDRSLLSVSSDQTARIWDVANKTIQHVQLLPHPSYVYCGKFDPRDASIVATGCYDRIVRIWWKEKRSTSYELVQELDGHEGFVNSMCFQKEGNLLTADSVGLIIIWAARKNRRAASKREWQVSRKIKVGEMEGVTINTIVLHPMETRLLAHSRNNGLRMLDLATGVVLQKYKGLNNQRIQSVACISPCGGLILCGGEDSSLNVWSFETGKYLARYTIDRTYRAVTCVDYHPCEHILAFSTFGSPAPARLLTFDSASTGEDVGLKLFTQKGDTIYPNAATFSILNETIEYNERFKSSSAKRESELSGGNNRVIRSTKSSRHGEQLLSNPEDERIRDDSRLKLDRRLNQMEMSVKSNSTNRLYRIIEKIDRILSNTSRSSDDIELGENVLSEKRYGLKDDDRVTEKSNRSQQVEDLNISDDSKIETLRMSKLEIESEVVQAKRMSRSAKSRRSESNTQAYQSPENERGWRKKGSRKLRERSSDESTYSVKSKSLQEVGRGKSRQRESSAYSDQSRSSENGADFERDVRKGNARSGDFAYVRDASHLSRLERKRAKSAKGWRSERLDETGSNAFSDSAANTRPMRRFVESRNDSTPSRKAKSMPAQSSDSTIDLTEKRQLRKVKGIENLTFQNNLVSSTSSQVNSQSEDLKKLRQAKKTGNEGIKKYDSTSDSGGTYVLEKADVETNEDYSLTKLVTNTNSSSNERNMNSRGSGNSLRSNATFILEHEKIPIPKPRKKKPSQG